MYILKSHLRPLNFKGIYSSQDGCEHNSPDMVPESTIARPLHLYPLAGTSGSYRYNPSLLG